MKKKIFHKRKKNSKQVFHDFQCIFSSGKSITAIVIAQLVEKKLLDYNEKIVKYWPAFGSNGKGNITLADILRHESGLSWINHTFSRDDFLLENIKANKIGQVFEKTSMEFPKRTKREYHYLTRDCLLNEIVRRVDPQGRTIGELILEVSFDLIL